MKIAIIGDTGHVGSAVTAEALRRGHEVTAILRLNDPDKGKLDSAVKVVEHDALALAKEDLSG